MAKKPMLESESKSNAGQAQSTPMPMRMPDQGASSSTNPQRLPGNELTKVSEMVDYPNGRGGMRMVFMLPAEQSAHPTPRPSSLIGAKPAVVKMPTNA